jgi:hypothetical protein
VQIERDPLFLPAEDAAARRSALAPFLPNLMSHFCARIAVRYLLSECAFGTVDSAPGSAR